MADKPPQDDLVAAAYRLHRGQVFRFLLRRTRHTQDAEDLTQKVFADAAAALSATDPPAEMLAWLYTVAERRFIDYVRRRNIRPEGRLDDDLADVRELDYGAATVSAIRDAVSSLPNDQRVVVVMKLFEDRTFAEIARRTGASEAACKMRFSRALAQLRAILRGQGLEP